MSNINKAELFKNEEWDRAFRDSHFDVYSSITSNLQSFYENCYGWYPLVKILYDEKLIKLWEKVPLPILQKCFGAIMAAYPNTGVHDSYTSIIKSLLGDDVTIEYSSPSVNHLVINVDRTTEVAYQWVTKKKDGKYVTTESGAKIVFNVLFGDITANDLTSILRALAPANILLEVFVTET